MERIDAGKYKFICFTDAGCKQMVSIAEKLPADGVEVLPVSSLSEWTGEVFFQGNILVFIGAIAIAVRAIAPFIKDKTTDPGVIVIDERGQFVIPILAGHIGGAIDATYEIAELLGAVPVVTTATDIRGEFAIDVFARRHDLEIDDMKLAKEFTAKLLSGEDAVFTVSPRTRDKAESYKVAGKAWDKDDSKSSSTWETGHNPNLIPRCLVVGMGCRKGKSFEELHDFLMSILSENRLDPRALKALVSIDIKCEEDGLRRLSNEFGIPFLTFSAQELMEQKGDFSSSEFALKTTGADNICERSVMAYGAGKMLVRKTARDGMTIAIGVYADEE
ncbi:cobalt-precorrin 5A hydrolase [Butyrivibrio sp. AE3006]|uniref:cobalt-precorrin 5A hydrolase n=1 Tax=Butyrivibrio sp. AE3006 TaxID=1280673 RepID=UPI00042463ED|nr:cobalamin biosynthesis protein [Butyrivibrio sp. AE3006]